MIRFACPACNKRLKAPAEGAGRTITCPRCSQPFVIQTTPDEEPIRHSPGKAAGRARGDSSPGGKVAIPPGVIAGGVGLALVVGFGVLIAVMMAGNRRPATPGGLPGQAGTSAATSVTASYEVKDALTQARGGGRRRRDDSGPEATLGKRYAVLIGVREYEEINSLRFTENDVTELAALLGKTGYEVTLLTDSEGKRDPQRVPTGANIRKAIETAAKQCKQADTLLLGFAGHGLQFSEDKDCYFCPRDAVPSSPNTLVSLTKVYEELGRSRAGAKLMLVDACRNDGARSVRRGIDGSPLTRPPSGIAVLFSCSPKEMAFETGKLGKGHGVFFYYVLEGLQGEASNKRGEVSWDTLNDFVRGQVARQVPKLIGGGAVQTPHGMTDLRGASPVLVRYDREAEPTERPEPRITPSEAPPVTAGTRQAYLSDMSEFDVLVSEGRFAKNGNLGYSAGGSDKIRVNGKEAPRGLSMCPEAKAYARARFRLRRTAQELFSTVALNDSAGAPGRPPGEGNIPSAVTFLVLGDGVVLWKSKPVDTARQVQRCGVDVRGVEVLELRVDCPGSHVNAHAVWIDPLVTLK